MFCLTSQRVLLAKIALLPFAAMAISACGPTSGSGDKAATQVAVKVGSKEISVHELTFAQRQKNEDPSNRSAGLQTLDELVRQELAVQGAVDLKLDRDPGMLLAMEASRRQLLAQAYVQRVTKDVTKPTATEIDDFIAQNPPLFRERRVFAFDEYDVPKEAISEADLRALANNPQSLRSAVVSKGLKVESRGVVRVAETMPLSLLHEAAKLQKGQILIQPIPSGSTVMTLAEVMIAPVPMEQARRLVEIFLTNQRKKTVADGQIENLRTRIEIAYQGQFTAPDPTTNRGKQPLR